MQDGAGAKLAEELGKVSMCLVNTDYNVGTTYVGQAGVSTRVDYICGPKEWVRERRVVRMKMRETRGTRLQKVVGTRGKIDHYPMAGWIAIRGEGWTRKRNDESWDWEKLGKPMRQRTEEEDIMKEEIRKIMEEWEKEGGREGREGEEE